VGRKPTITRDGLLDAAEELVREQGGSALTIGALAKAAGISKGGVQYSFASRDDLVRSLVDRWTTRFDAMLEDAAADDPVEFIRSYIAATRTSPQAMDAKTAGLMVSYLENPEHLREAREWYWGIFDRLTGASPDAQAARVIFLAVEGLFLLRINGIDEDGVWTSLLDDVDAVLRRLT
jgi:AcrR family transcriptional regulator